MKKTFHILLLVLLANLHAAGQSTSAGQVLDNLLNTVKTNAIRAKFILSASEMKSSTPQTSTGSFTLKGTRFILEMDEMKVWFDGKTQWAYAPRNNEVTITEPTEKELAETNPLAILSAYKSKSVINFSKTKSGQNHILEIIPKTQNPNVSKIEIQVNKNTQNLQSIKITNKKGGIILLTLSNFEKGLNIPDNHFVFNRAKFKGAVENDLR
ncbi:MAG TPA: outer membrane lipoprotein carrier protein LolA [Paludibacter sp.]|nr:outer membrane lipoprotein carrier protein LolA [Paludibacter sp.]